MRATGQDKVYEQNHKKNVLRGTVKRIFPPHESKMGSYRNGVGQVRFVGASGYLAKHETSGKQ
jgi:hypothetical protein